VGAILPPLFFEKNLFKNTWISPIIGRTVDIDQTGG
jgi:hypothetical protein